MPFAARIERLRREYCRPSADEITTLTAVDFLHGGGPRRARAFDRRGVMLGAIDRLDEETIIAFQQRAHGEAQRHAGATRLVLGGIGPHATSAPALELPQPAMGIPRGQIRGMVSLPDIPLHPSQREAVKLVERSRRVCLVCGRRWGKSTTITVLAVDYALCGKNVAVLAPTYRFIRPLQNAIIAALRHLPSDINRTHGELNLKGGGSVSFWSLDHTGRSLRGTGLDLVLVDESAHDEGYLADTLEAAIGPATLDRRGKIVLASTPNGLAGAFWEAANMPERGYVVHHAPTSANPHLPVDEISYLRSTLRPEVASQELDAVFLDTGGATIFPLHALLIHGEPHSDDGFFCDYVGLAIDSNSGKGGPDRDGCAAVIFALTLPDLMQGSVSGARVVIVDWDIQSLAQGGVAPWLTNVRERTMAWFHHLKPLRGLPQAHIEPAGNGYAIIEGARAQGLHPNEIDAKYVALGKDGRALAVEPHATGGRVKLSRSALDKRTNYRGIVANHLVRQVTGFRAFDKDAYRREDDLFDATMYAVLASLGDGTEARWSRLRRASAIT
jgi:hypothetical protein